jgi:hypothetical protein
LYFENRADRQQMILSSTNGDLASSSKSKKGEEDACEMDTDDGKLKNGHSGENGEEDHDSQEQGGDSLDNKHNETKIFEQIINRLKYRFRARVVIQETIHSLSKD